MRKDAGKDAAHITAQFSSVRHRMSFGEVEVM
jgi:hypothetical protein